MLIETLNQLNELVACKIYDKQQCVLVIEDNKSSIPIQSVIVKHPLDFIRNLNEFSQNARLPVTDIDILLVGFLGYDYLFTPVEEISCISPYVYFKKPEEVSINVGSDGSTPPVES